MSSPPVLIEAHRVHPLGGHPAADALLIRDGAVAAVGGIDELRAAAPPGTRSWRLPGLTVTPGLTDSHVHLTSWALARRRVDLAGTASLEDGLDRIRGHLADAGGEMDAWVLGQGWDRNRWGGFPDRHALDRVVGDRPAHLESHDIHAAWLNTAALRRCGIDAATADPPGGRIVRDPDSGEPTGVLLENAKALALPHLPVPGRAAVRDALLDAQSELHTLGITGVHSVEVDGLADFGDLERDDRLRLRVLQHLPVARLDDAVGLGLRSGWRSPGAESADTARHRNGEPVDWIRIGGIKLFLDGALGSRTAWLREPYLETVGDCGIPTMDADEFRELVRWMTGAGFAAAVHAIGDSAVELALEVLSAHPGPARLPHRIEHVQLCPPDLWDRAGRSGIVGSVQPVHLRSDIPAAERYWGHERCIGAYAFAALAAHGMTLAFGSDAPVETVDPRQGLFAAVRRVDWSGGPQDGWFAEHAVTPEQALHGYTEAPAFAAGVAHRHGRLLPGYDADLAVWDVDPLACEPEQLLEMRCMLTIVAGEPVHGEPGS